MSHSNHAVSAGASKGGVASGRLNDTSSKRKEKSPASRRSVVVNSSSIQKRDEPTPDARGSMRKRCATRPARVTFSASGVKSYAELFAETVSRIQSRQRSWLHGMFRTWRCEPS
jgi:hypothetical protein